LELKQDAEFCGKEFTEEAPHPFINEE